MTLPRFRRAVRASLLALLLSCLLSFARAQGARPTAPETPVADANADHVQERVEWFLRGRTVPGKSSAELRHRAYQAKMQARAARLARAQTAHPDAPIPPSSGTWTPLGPVPLASNAFGSGPTQQDYHQVSGRATAVAIDPADPTGNTVYIGGAQGGVWKSTNAAASVANNVTWTPVTDDQATLSIGSIAIQPGNTDPTKSVILVGTGEADNSGDSYFGLGILRSADGGSTWMLISSANGGTYLFNGLGATRMAFSTANPNTVVAAMAATAVGQVDDSLTTNTFRGLYTSTDAGQTWTYNALFAGAGEATSATSVVYNAAAGMFFAAERYHGFYSSPDGLIWTRLASQPGAPGLLSTTACPQNYLTTCPIYRGEITVVPGRNEMYVWFVSLGSTGTVDQGIWQSKNGGTSWTQISDSGISNCGDPNGDGCGVLLQGAYDLELLAVPNGNANTDLYAGAINLYKCSIGSSNPTCSTPFINLTHVYGCSPNYGALAHVHPDQHALAFTIPSSGTDLMYFANDGGIYRALDGFTGLTTGSCSGTNLFDDLNQNLGSMTQFVSFSQHSTNVDMILGGTQDNGSPATATATTNPSWGNVLGGDGGYNAIDSSSGDWFASQPDAGSSGLNIQECPSGVNCNNLSFNVVVSSSNLGGDNGGFYFPYILDPQSASSLLVGTCRVWRGPRLGGTYSDLSLNFDTRGTGTCSGGEVNLVRALAAGGPQDTSGSSKVIYATTDGFGPNTPTTPAGGNVWVTTNAAPVSGVSSTFSNVTQNGPGGSSINPNNFPISAVAIDTSDISGNTAYVTVMGFTQATGGLGHVWQTTNAGGGWTDFTGTGTNALPDDPVNAVVVDPSTHIIYVGTDVGVFQSPTSAPAWTELGPTTQQSGFLPNVAVTALALFNNGAQKLLRASTYGRGVWQFDLITAPDFQILVPNPTLTAFAGTTPTFNGTATSVNGYSSSVALTCTAGSTNPPNPCTPNPASFTPASTGTAFSVATGSALGDYSFNVQAAGSDSNHTTHVATLTLSVVNFGLTAASPTRITDPHGTTSPPVSFQVTAQGSFGQEVDLTCGFSPAITGATCAFNPGATVFPTSGSPVNATATVTVPAATAVGNYTVTLQATTAGAPAPLTTSFTLAVTLNPNFSLSEPSAFPNVKLGSTGTSGPITISAQDGFTGTVTLDCGATFGVGSCSVSPTSVSTFPATVTLVINGSSFTNAGTGFQLSLAGTSGSITNSVGVPFDVGSYLVAGPMTPSSTPGGQVSATLTFTSIAFYSGQVSASCDASALSGAQCSLSPPSPITIGSGAVVAATATINVPNNAAPGTYNININTQDVTGAPSNLLTMVLTVFQDFTLGSLTPSTTQTITAGQSASYNFNVLPVGSSFTNAVNLSCSGAPTISLCAFTPNPATPGNNVTGVGVVLKISTTHSSASLSAPGTTLFYALWLALPGLALLGTRRRRRKRAKLSLAASLLGLFLLALLVPSCGGGSNGGGGGGGGGQQQGTLPGTYTITVTGTSGTLTHQAASVTLVVNP
jgi:hypothetical protein